MSKSTKQNEKINEEIKKLVIARIKAYSDKITLSLGGLKKYSREELIECIENEDELGKEIIEIQMEYLKDMAEGNFYNACYE